jgi:hypothetical protein
MISLSLPEFRVFEIPAFFLVDYLRISPIAQLHSLTSHLGFNIYSFLKHCPTLPQILYQKGQAIASSLILLLASFSQDGQGI